jgi:hypothetical protein
MTNNESKKQEYKIYPSDLLDELKTTLNRFELRNCFFTFDNKDMWIFKPVEICDCKKMFQIELFQNIDYMKQMTIDYSQEMNIISYNKYIKGLTNGKKKLHTSFKTYAAFMNAWNNGIDKNIKKITSTDIKQYLYKLWLHDYAEDIEDIRETDSEYESEIIYNIDL